MGIFYLSYHIRLKKGSLIGGFSVLDYREKTDYNTKNMYFFQDNKEIQVMSTEQNNKESYEQQICQLKQQVEALQNTVQELQDQLLESSNEIAVLNIKYRAEANQREHYWKLNESLTNSVSWRMTRPFRDAMQVIRRAKTLFTNSHLLVKGIRSLRKDGFHATWVKAKYKLSQITLAKQPIYSPEELEAQKTEEFPRKILFSILVPLYNTPEKYLREMIRSVLDQTYGNWELCLADGSDEAHASVEQVVREFADADPRIRYQKLESNMGISGNTNACIDMARGDYISLFDHDDLLHPAALYDTMKAICEQNADFIYTDETTFHKTPSDAYNPHFKPNYAPDTLRGCNYICHFTSFKASLLDTAGRFRPECDGSQDFDMVLRLTEKAEKIVHIPKILYYWRAHPKSVAASVGAKPYVVEAAKKALADHLERVGLKGMVLESSVSSVYRLWYEIDGDPLVSVLIPNYEHKAELETCLNSIYEKTTYENFEVIVIENNSKSQEIFDYYEEIQKKWENLKVVTWEGHFNFSAINNFGAKFAAGSHLLLLNNDTEVIAPDWIQEMLMFSQRSDVGAVGAKLYYPDDSIQHAGLALGVLKLAGHLHRNFDRWHPGYMGRLSYVQNLSGVTAACVMVRRDVWDRIGGLDESFEVAFNDVDMCMRIRAAGYLIVWTPFAELYHYESKSRGLDEAPEKRVRFVGEVERFQARWARELEAGDPYYNPNLTLEKEDLSVRG